MKRTLTAWLVVAGLAAIAQGAPIPTITLLPSSTSGNPGTAIGWGFVLTYSTSSDWVVLTGSQFTGSQVYGTYVDYLSRSNAPLYVAGPSPEISIVQQTWNSNSSPLLGVGEFDLNSTALTGASITGNILVHYSVFSQDPNSASFNPDTSTEVADATVSAPIQVTVSPEPASFFLVALAAFPIVLAVRRQRSTARPINFPDLTNHKH